MSTRNVYSQESINSLENKLGITIPFTPVQTSNLEENGRTELEPDQINSIIEELCIDEHGLSDLIENLHPQSPGISVSLFVLNEALEKIMLKKATNPDKMLPMITLPWFHWAEKAVTSNNPSGVRRDDTSDGTLRFDKSNQSITITGLGGDFSGIVEGRVASRGYSMWRAIAPEFPGSKDLVPYYQCQSIKVQINLGAHTSELYPQPLSILDYTFSESPKVFMKHGLGIEVDGSNVTLSIGRKRGTQLKGTTKIFIGRPFSEDTPEDSMLAYNLWLHTLKKALSV